MSDAEDRLDRLESIFVRQQETIETQRERIAELEDDGRAPDERDAARPTANRRTALKAGGLLALLGLGADTAAADPQGQVGTEADPIETVHAAATEGPLTGGVRLESLVGEGLAVRDGKLTNAIDVPALSVSDISVPNVDEADSYTVDVTVEETAGIQTDGLSVTLEIPTGDGSVDERTVEPTDIQGETAEATFGNDSAFDPLDPGEYTATVTVDATNAEPATASEQFTVEALFAGGDGSSENPFEIATWHHLDNVRNELGDEFVLVADLTPTTDGYDAVASGSANGGDGFEPIGSDTAQFTGSFDGDGHVVEGLTIRRSDEDSVGMFGDTGSDALVADVALVATDVTGASVVGALVGVNEGAVERSYVTGSASGESDVGGLVGQIAANGRVERSYATVNVSGVSGGGYFVAGLVGDNQGTVERSYATGNVSGSSEVDGFVGNNNGTVTDSYWDTESTEQDSGVGLGVVDATGLTTSKMTGATPAPEGDDTMSAFDFADVWETVSADDSDVSEDGYPVLQALDREAQLEARE